VRTEFTGSHYDQASSPRYTRVAIALHWIVAVVVIAQFAWGWWMQEIPKQPPGSRAAAFNLHKSVGLVIFALMLLRLGWRMRHRAPALGELPAWQQLLARCTHVTLHAALFAMPIAGYLGSVFSGYPVKWFGVTLPAWGWKDPVLKELMSAIHLTVSWIIAGAFTLHVMGAFKHMLEADEYPCRMGLPVVRSARRVRKRAGFEPGGA
jgi:cytochrome b561